MKRIILLAFLIIALGAKAQSDKTSSITIKVNDTLSMVMYIDDFAAISNKGELLLNNSANSISFYSNGKYTIIGDTAKAIKGMMKGISK